MNRIYNTQDFIKKAKQIHENKYDYSKVDYVNSHTKVCIICPEHGEFWQTPSNHLNKTHACGCSKCGLKEKIRKRIKPQNQFIEEANEIHNNKYIYSKVEYINTQSKVCIICPEHGEFYQTPANHLRGQGCPKCKIEKLQNINLLTTQDFIKKSKEVHGNKYDYSKSVYKSAKETVCIICPVHGEFWQAAYDHAYGYNCPFCNESKGEEKIRLFLISKNINFIKEHKFEWLINPITEQNLRLDFYLPDYNIAIEYQGEQHFKPIDFGGGYQKSAFLKVQYLDKLKHNLCKKHNVPILYINYFDKNIIDKLNIYLNKVLQNNA